MKKVCTNLVVVLLALGLLSGCGGRRRQATAMKQQASEAKTTIAVLESKVESQQTRIEALEKELAELREK